MNIKDIPMVPNRKTSLPLIYGDTPSFLGSSIAGTSSDFKDSDVVVMGVPWEGTITWGSYTGCELAPKVIRHAAARYGGYLPEYKINFFDYLNMADAGDVQINASDPDKTMEMIRAKADEIYKHNSIPIAFGGDHSYTPEIVKALRDNTQGKIGVIHFDAHLDNMKSFNEEDRFPRCGPIYRLAQIPQVKKDSIVHIGIRGPRNAPSQFEYAEEIGATVFTNRDIRNEGIEKIISRAIERAYDGTDAVYVTICSDVVEAAYNPGGPPDFDGLSPHELFYALNQLGWHGIRGLDFVEIYPMYDVNGMSAHLATWSIIHALVGMAERKKAQMSF
jgi:agmatinase